LTESFLLYLSTDADVALFKRQSKNVPLRIFSSKNDTKLFGTVTFGIVTFGTLGFGTLIVVTISFGTAVTFDTAVCENCDNH